MTNFVTGLELALASGPYIKMAADYMLSKRAKPPKFLFYFNENDYEVCISRDVTVTQKTDNDYFEGTFAVHRRKRKWDVALKSSVYKRYNAEGGINDQC